MSYGWPPQGDVNHQGSTQWRLPPPFSSPPPPPNYFQPTQWGGGPFPPTPPRMQRSPYNGNYNRIKQKKARKEPVFTDYCDVCDRGFKNNAKKIEHYQQHVKCDEPGCSFEAHFKLVAMHKQNLHGPNGLRVKLETPEEIERWREERKRKYPSASNIQKKEMENDERRKQGNVLDNKQFGKMRVKKQKTSTTPVVPTFNSPNHLPEKLQNTAQTSLLLSNPQDLSGEISSGEEATTVTTLSKGCATGLGSIMQSYASDSESESEENQGNENQLQNKDSTVSAVVGNPDNSTIEPASCKPKQEIVSQPKFRDHSKSAKPMRRQNNFNNKQKRQSLLEMLLANDIRKERNHILQCVRYIVKNNFFESEVPVGADCEM